MIFSTYFADEQDQVVEEWWRYDLASGEVLALPSPYNIPQQIWDELKAVPNALLPVGTVSPSGERLIYTRPPGDSPPDPTSGFPDSPAMEVWIAHIDGSSPIRVAGPSVDCQTIGTVIWSRHETEVIFSCGTHGPKSIYLAAADGSGSESLADKTGVVAGEGFSGTELSPDESTLAFTDFWGTLHLVAFNGDQVQSIPFGLEPNWSPDSRRVYYLKGTDEMFGTVAGICMYDLDTHTETEIISLPAHAVDGQELPLLAGAGEFAVSPSENALVFQSGGLWLATLHTPSSAQTELARLTPTPSLTPLAHPDSR